MHIVHIGSLFLLGFVLTGPPGLAQEPGSKLDSGLVGHWQLQGDAKDSSGQGNHGVVHGVDLAAAGPGGKPRTAARFNGRDDWIEVPASKSLRLGKEDFSIAVWVHTAKELDDVLGDIAGQFDPATGRGFHLGIANANVTTSQANYRQVYFGLGTGQTEGKWVDCGRPGKSVYAHALAVFDGQLYCGTCEPGEGEAGHVYRYDGNQQWLDCGSPDPCNAVAGLAAYNGKLYAGVSRYRLKGSALPESANPNQGGKVYRYDGERRWTDCGKLGDAEAVGGLAVYRGQLYASSTYSPGVYRYDGGQKWTCCGCGPQKRRIVALAVFNGHLYGSSYDGGRVFRYHGDTAWTQIGELPGATQTYGFAVHAGKMYVSTWPKAEVFRYDGDNHWTNCGRLGSELEVMGLTVANGRLYAGTLPLAQVYRYHGGTTWSLTGQLDITPDVRYRRAWTLAVFQGQLFGGTLPSGRVYALAIGPSVTWDRELAPGWRHLAAVREGKVLKLYLDGKPAATSAPFSPADCDIANDRPLTIGFGQHDYFNGLLSDLRWYRRALTAAEAAALAGQP